MTDQKYFLKFYETKWQRQTFLKINFLEKFTYSQIIDFKTEELKLDCLTVYFY